MRNNNKYMSKITVPVCDNCRKPHYGRSRVEDRCICDVSNQYHYEQIEEEIKEVA